MVRSILAVVLAFIVASVLITAVEFVGHLLYPPLSNGGPGDMEAMRASWAQAPIGAKLFVLLAWAVGSLAGGWVAAWIARRAAVVHALIVGALLMAAGVYWIVVLDSPVWFWVVALATFLPPAYVGARFAPSRQPRVA